MNSIQQYVLEGAPLSPHDVKNLITNPEILIDGIHQTERELAIIHGENIDSAPETNRLKTLLQLSAVCIRHNNLDGYTGGVSTTLEPISGRTISRNRPEPQYY